MILCCAQVINKLEILSCPIAKSGSTSLKETIRIIQSKIKDKSLPAKRHDQNHTFDTVGHKFKDLGIQNQIEQSNYHFLFSFEQKKRMKLFFDFCPKNIVFKFSSLFAIIQSTFFRLFWRTALPTENIY